MFVDVALDIGTFVYSVPEELESEVKVGSLVRVPLKSSVVEGWVVEKTQNSKLKTQKLNIEIKNILNISWRAPLISQHLIELGKWMLSYYQSSLGAALNLMVPEIAGIANVGAIYELPLPYKPKGKGKLPSAISDSLKQKKFKNILLYGPNRREIYLRAIDEALSYGMGAIFLVPEIKSTPEIFSIFQRRFGSANGGIALLHSGLKKDERWAEWLRIKEGVARVVVGTMSAVFAPICNLGIIIVDEEQDTSYKSEKHPRYSTPVVGTMRAKLESCLYVSGSNTPSIEAFYNTETKESTLIRLIYPKREGKISVVDMRKEGDQVFSALLKRKLKEYITNHKKIILFLNRRGFSSFILCEDCGYIPKCPICGISYTYHRIELSLKCHYCGYHERAIGYCPQCKGTNLSYRGVGTGRVEKTFLDLFPGVNMVRLDLDAVSSKYTSHIFNSFIKDEIPVLLGTQLIAKPIKFPQVGLVGIISADIGLNLPDFRAPERIFSLLMRLAEKGAEAVLQTYNPEHRVIRYLASQDYLSFYKYEKLARREHNYPPHSHLIRILIESRDEAQAKEKANKIALQLKEMELEVLGPSPCPFERKKGKFRVHLLLKVKNPQELKLPEIIPPATIVDVDPIDLL